MYIYYMPWEPTTIIFRGYYPYLGGLKPSFFMVLGSKGMYISMCFCLYIYVYIYIQKRNM